ncbi:unnamed protein product, partial [Mycena citricolor]
RHVASNVEVKGCAVLSDGSSRHEGCERARKAPVSVNRLVKLSGSHWARVAPTAM